MYGTSLDVKMSAQSQAIWVPASRTQSGRLGNFIGCFVLRLVVVLSRAASDLFSAVIVMKHKLLFMPLNSASPAQQWQLMRNGNEDNRKATPKHVCLAIVESKMTKLEDISRVAVWCHALGVKFISFFDASGALNSFPDVLRQELEARLFECRQSKDSILLLQPNEDVRNIDVHSRSIARTLDANYGTVKLGNVVGRILNEAVKAKENALRVADINYNVKEIENQLSVAFSLFPDPECVLCFGPTSSAMKFLPWQLNHAEIIRMGSHHNILPSQFLQALERYTKIEKRFGK